MSYRFCLTRRSALKGCVGTGLGLDDPRRRRGKLSRDIKVFCLMARAWEMINGGMQAWVGRARTADARFLRSIIDRCVSLLDSIASPFWLSIHSRSCSHILCCKASILPSFHTFHTFTHPSPPRPHNNRPPWLLSSRPVPRLSIPSLHEELRTRIS